MYFDCDWKLQILLHCSKSQENKIPNSFIFLAPYVNTLQNKRKKQK